MKLKSLLLVLGIFIAPAATVSETYKESFECQFGRGLANRPTPSRMVFSVDEFGRSALLHNVEISKIDTNIGTGRIKRDTPRLLSIAWVGRDYTYTATGFTYASNEARIDAIDLRDLEFSVLLDRRTMKAIAKSSSNSAYASRDGFANGSCVAIAAPKS